MKLCDWLKNHAKLPDFPTQTTIQSFDRELKEHLAACKVCQTMVGEYGTLNDRAGEMPIALIKFIANAADQMMKAKTAAIETTMSDYVYYVFRVLQDWKLISWNELMLHLRESWARRLDD